MSEYLEIAGHKFDLQILTEGFKDPNGPNACTSRCCQHGVYLDPTERDRILAHADVVEKYLDETQTRDRSKWFDNSEDEDSDFPSGKCVSTEVFNDKCVFLDKKGRCVLQVAEMEEKMPRFSLKPYYCILFPIVKVDGVFQYDGFCSGESECCTASRESADKMVELCSIELQHALGMSKYNEVLKFYRDNFVESKSQEATDIPFVQTDSLETGKDATDAAE
jgi:Protein of unknown function (DUF3109)